MFSGDLFDMLLPMLSIYQEYVRNHHYCLQVNWSGVRLRKVPGVEIYLLEAPSKSRFYQVIQTSRDSSVGRALDWRSKGPRFDPGSRHWLWALFTCHGGRVTPFISQGYRFSSCSILLMVQLQIFNPHLTLFIMDMEYSIILSALYYHRNYSSIPFTSFMFRSTTPSLYEPPFIHSRSWRSASKTPNSPTSSTDSRRSQRVRGAPSRRSSPTQCIRWE